MAIYKTPALSGTRVYRTKKTIKNERHSTCMTFGEVVPIFGRFVLPGDIWKPKLSAFIRYKPTLAPILTECNAYFRFFFVPLRQVEDDTEKVITGSKNGSLITSELPKFKNFVKEFLDTVGNDHASLAGKHACVHKNSFYPLLGVRPNTCTFLSTGNHYVVRNYDAEKDEPDFAAAYWYKAYCKIIWEYFRDENYQSFDGDFEKFYEYMLCNKGYSDVQTNGWWFGPSAYEKLQSNPWESGDDPTTEVERNCLSMGSSFWKLWFCNLNKDYFTSSLPWIMKGVQPTINSVMHADFSSVIAPNTYSQDSFAVGVTPDKKLIGGLVNSSVVRVDATGNNNLKSALSNVPVTNGGFTASDIRDMFAETRVFERLARCGSRYVEYLESNFGIAPRDDTLQRPLYLGGFSQPIVTTEVVQTAQGSDPVGTMRGHGISSGGNSIRPFAATEFGMIFALMYVRPKTQYLVQMRRELTYKSRFDFFNPSFQLLSEQQVGNLEFNIPVVEADSSVSHQDGAPVVEFNKIPRFTYGYQGMYNELRYGSDLITRDLSGNLAYWTQAISVSDLEATTANFATPPLNGQNLSVGAYLDSLLRPFEARNGDFKPMIVDVGLGGSVYRPMVKDPIPSLTDHN